MAETVKVSKRNKPLFRRKDWHKVLKLGRKSRKLRKWRASKGRHGKIRLSRKGQSAKPKIGWGNARSIRDLVSGHNAVRVSNVNEVSKVSKDQAIIIASVGRKNRLAIIDAAQKLKIKIINNFKEKQ